MLPLRARGDGSKANEKRAELEALFNDEPFYPDCGSRVNVVTRWTKSDVQVNYCSGCRKQFAPGFPPFAAG
jgi:hypothetical protein